MFYTGQIPEPGNLVFFTELLGEMGDAGCRQGLLWCPYSGGLFQQLQPLKDANSFCSMQTSPENLRTWAASPQGPTATMIISENPYSLAEGTQSGNNCQRLILLPWGPGIPGWL